MTYPFDLVSSRGDLLCRGCWPCHWLAQFASLPAWIGRVNTYPRKQCTLRFREQGNYEYFMMDWTRLVSEWVRTRLVINLLEIIVKQLPRDCMLQGYMFASLNGDEQISVGIWWTSALLSLSLSLSWSLSLSLLIAVVAVVVVVVAIVVVVVVAAAIVVVAVVVVVVSVVRPSQSAASHCNHRTCSERTDSSDPSWDDG